MLLKRAAYFLNSNTQIHLNIHGSHGMKWLLVSDVKVEQK